MSSLYRRLYPTLGVLVLALAATLIAVPAGAQSALVPVTQLIATGGTLVAGDVTFSNFMLAPPRILFSGPLDGVNNIAASAVDNADGTVSLVFTAVDPVTGAPNPITAASQQLIAYDVTVTNPSLLLSAVNQDYGPATLGEFNFLQYREPAPFVATPLSGFANDVLRTETLIFDQSIGSDQNGTLVVSRAGMFYGLSCHTIVNGLDFGLFGGPNGCPSPLPGGYRSSLSLQNFFGVSTDKHGFIFNVPDTLPIAFDAIAMTFTLVPADTPVTAVAVTLDSIDVSISGSAFVRLADTLDADGLLHPSFAPADGVPVVLSSSDAAALPLPPVVVMPQGSRLFGFPVGEAQVDGPTPVTATATFDGVTVTQTVTVTPAVPLAIAALAGGPLHGAQTPTLQLFPVLNRTNVSPAVIAFSSSNPAIAPVPASVTIPALTVPGSFFFRFPYQPQAVATAVTFSASFNGATITGALTLPPIVDMVAITKAELVVKNGALKVEATSTVPTAVLTLFNAVTGQLIGTMTNNGSIGAGAKYAFQGTVSPVTLLRLTSSLSGTATGAVAQK